MDRVKALDILDTIQYHCGNIKRAIRATDDNNVREFTENLQMYLNDLKEVVSE